MGTSRSKLVVYATIYAKNDSRSISQSFFALKPKGNACYAGAGYALTGKLILVSW